MNYPNTDEKTEKDGPTRLKSDEREDFDPWQMG